MFLGWSYRPGIYLSIGNFSKNRRNNVFVPTLLLGITKIDTFEQSLSAPHSYLQ